MLLLSQIQNESIVEWTVTRPKRFEADFLLQLIMFESVLLLSSVVVFVFGKSWCMNGRQDLADRHESPIEDGCSAIDLNIGE